MMASLLKKLLGEPALAGVNPTYITLVAQARNPFFYTHMGVPDTIDGRFEMMVLHLFLLQHRLLGEDTEFARQLSEAFFADMDRTIREFGVMDTGVGKRVKRMGKAYHGRLQAYEAGLSDAVAMRAALARNLYGTVAEGDIALLDAMADYMTTQVARLTATNAAIILSGDYRWTAPATAAA
jgi:cytochrome b pre-mRNA-processing protein 3